MNLNLENVLIAINIHINGVVNYLLLPMCWEISIVLTRIAKEVMNVDGRYRVERAGGGMFIQPEILMWWQEYQKATKRYKFDWERADNYRYYKRFRDSIYPHLKIWMDKVAELRKEGIV